MLEATTFVPPSPPVTLGEETRKIPVFNYKPTALQWWFMAVLVAVLITLTALTEHSLRSLPGYGLDHDLEKRTRSITERQFPRFVPQVRNITAVRTSFLPPDSNTAAISAQAPVGATSEATAELPALGTSSIASYESTATSRTATKQEDSSKPTRVPTASSKSSIQSIKSSPTQNTHGQTSQAQILESETSQSRTVVGPTSTAQVSESHPLPAGNGAHQTHNEVLTSAKSPTTSTSICFGCSVVFSTAASAYLSLGTVTSTVHVEPTLAASEIPSTIILQQATTLPDSTTVIQHVATNPAGSTVSEAVTSTVPGASGTLQLTVVLHPGQSWVTTTGPVVVSTVSSQTAMYTTALTNGAGERITSIYLTTLSPTPLIVTTTYGTVVGSANRPDPTSSPSSSSDTTANSVVIVIGISRSQYLIGSFLPTILAVLVAMPLKAIDNNARLFQPFIALATSKTGTTAEASIFLRLYGWRSVLGAFPRTCRLRQPVVIVGRLLVAGAALLAPLAAEAVKVHVPDDCTGACPGSLGLDRTSGRALQVLLVLLIALLVAMVALLAWLKTGVRQNPWSIAGMAALGVNKELRDLLKGLDRGLERLIHNSEISGALDRRRYALNGDGVASRYGIRVTDFPVMLSEDLLKKNKKEAEKQRTVAGRAPSIPLYLLTLQGRIVLLLFISAVLVLLLYYENSWGDTGLERFMDGQGFGVRFFFTALGVALGFSMIRFFRCRSPLFSSLVFAQRADSSIQVLRWCRRIC